MSTILLLGTHGQSNWGDDILLETFLQELGPEHTYYVNSYDPKETERAFKGRYRLTCFHTTGELFTLLRFLLSSDVVFFAGGTILRELYPDSGRNKYSSLFMVTALAWFARHIARKRVIMSNIGVGPLPSSFGKAIARVALNATVLASFRDERSMELARACGIREGGDFRVVPDCVFVQPSSFFLKSETSTEHAVPRIGINVVYDVATPELREKYLAVLGGALSRFVMRAHALISPVPMQIAYNPHTDVHEIAKFLEDHQIPHRMHVPNSPHDLGRLIASCDMLIAARYHAIVIGAILGRPSVALIYDVKVASLVERLGIAEYALDIRTPLIEDEVLDKIELLEKRQGEVALHLKERCAYYRDELTAYFADIRRIVSGARV